MVLPLPGVLPSRLPMSATKLNRAIRAVWLLPRPMHESPGRIPTGSKKTDCAPNRQRLSEARSQASHALTRQFVAHRCGRAIPPMGEFDERVPFFPDLRRLVAAQVSNPAEQNCSMFASRLTRPNARFTRGASDQF